MSGSPWMGIEVRVCCAWGAGGAARMRTVSVLTVLPRTTAVNAL